MRRLSVAIAVPLMVIVMAGCGLSGRGDKTATTADPLLSTTTTIPYVFPPQLTAVAGDVQKALLASAVQKDFPTGWNSNSLDPTSKPDEAVIDEAFVQCLFGATSSPLSAYVVSPVMAGPDGNSIAQSFVRVVASKDAAKADFVNFKAERVSACQIAMYTRQFSLPDGTKIVGKKYGYAPPDAIPVSPLLAPDASKDVIGFRFLVSPRDASAVYEDLFAYGIGRFEVVLLFQDSKRDPDSATETSALTAIKARAQVAARS